MTCSHPGWCQCDGRGIVPGPQGKAVFCPCMGCRPDNSLTVNQTRYDCEVCGENLPHYVTHNHYNPAIFKQLVMALDDIGGKMRLGEYENVSMLAFIWEQNRNKIFAGETTWQQERRSVFKE